MSKNTTSICRRTVAAILTLTSYYASVRAKGYYNRVLPEKPVSKHTQAGQSPIKTLVCLTYGAPHHRMYSRPASITDRRDNCLLLTQDVGLLSGSQRTRAPKSPGPFMLGSWVNKGRTTPLAECTRLGAILARLGGVQVPSS